MVEFAFFHVCVHIHVGAGQTTAMKYGKNQKYATEQQAVAAAKRWVEAEVAQQGL